MLKKVIVKAPATSANLGPCFDCLGVALNLYCKISIEKNSKDEICIKGICKDHIKKNADNLVMKIISAFCKKNKISRPKLKIEIDSDIPIGRGLGSSASAVVATLIACNNFFGLNYSKEELLNYALKFEPHPDNIAPSFFGGLVMSSYFEGEAFYYKFEEFKKYKDISFVVLIPEYFVYTQNARKFLTDTKKCKHENYVFGLSNSIANIIALSRGEFSSLNKTMNDTIWHQKQRKNTVKYMDEIIKSALAKGAYGASLSGSGPTIISICKNSKAKLVGESMKKVLDKKHIKSNYKILKLDNKGCVVN
jgi:homoserine kinase